MQAPLIDIGANLTDGSFKKDCDEVIEKAFEAEVIALLITGTDVDNSTQAVQLCAQYPDSLYSTAGIHPHYVEQANDESLARIKELCQNPCVKAIGETGLDFFRDLSPRKVQEKLFEDHIELAIQMKMPLFLHQRHAHLRFTEIIKAYRDDITDAVVHCFTDDQKALFEYLDMDLHIGITGWICDERRGLELQKMVSNIPLNRLMLETDSPYLIPRDLPADLKPKKNARRNEPQFLRHIAEQVTKCYGSDMATIAQQTTLTATNFFGLPAQD